MSAVNGSSQGQTQVPDVIKQQVVQGRGNRPRKEGRRDTGWIGADNVFEMIQQQSKIQPDNSPKTYTTFKTAEAVSPASSPTRLVNSLFPRANQKVSPYSPTTPSPLRTAVPTNAEPLESPPGKNVAEERPKPLEEKVEEIADRAKENPDITVDDFISNEDVTIPPIRAIESVVDQPIVHSLMVILDRIGRDFRVSAPLIYRTLGFISFFLTLRFFYTAGLLITWTGMVLLVVWFAQLAELRRGSSSLMLRGENPFEESSPSEEAQSSSDQPSRKYDAGPSPANL